MKKIMVTSLLLGACLLTGCSKSAKDLNKEGMELYNNGKYDKAVVSLEQAVKKDSDNFDYKINLAKAYEKNSQYDKAAACIAGVADKAEDKSKDDLYYMLASYYFEAGKNDEGVKAVENFVNTNYKTYSYYLKGYELLTEYDLTLTAESLLEQAVNLGATEAEEYNDLGLVYYYLGEYEKALKNFENAQTSGYSKAAINVGNACVIMGDTTTALNAYEYYRKNVGDTAYVSNQLCNLYINTGEYDKAIEAAERGLAMADVNEKRTLMFNRIVAYEKACDYSKALELAVDFMEKYPDDEQGKAEYDFLKSRN